MAAVDNIEGVWCISKHGGDHQATGGRRKNRGRLAGEVYTYSPRIPDDPARNSGVPVQNFGLQFRILD